MRVLLGEPKLSSVFSTQPVKTRRLSPRRGHAGLETIHPLREAAPWGTRERSNIGDRINYPAIANL